MKYRTFLKLSLCLLLCLVSCACTRKKIEFNRHSAVEDVYKKVTPIQDTAIESGGIIIYKANDNSARKVNLGPKDLDFDVKVKF